jgi:putative tryptophan/tyrosine transport system substrate-binding protein
MTEVGDQNSEIGKAGRRAMTKKIIFLALCSLLFAPCCAVDAQQPKKISRIGYLTGDSISAMSSRRAAFREGLRELGYVEGKNIVVEWQGWEGKQNRQRALAAELVRLKVDVIVAVGSGDIRAANEATATIPIVMVQGGDAVGSGFVTSLARPGGNITGLATLRPELSGKRLEILKEIVPKLSRVAVFASSSSRDYAQIQKEIELAATALGVKVQYLEIQNPKDVETAFQAAVKRQADAILFRVGGPVLYPQRAKIAELAVKSRLPVIYERAEEVEGGGLMSYGLNTNDLYRRAATYVDKILKGAKPADLPVEQPTKFDFVINLKSAKQIGLTIPPNVLARADRVIK